MSPWTEAFGTLRESALAVAIKGVEQDNTHANAAPAATFFFSIVGSFFFLIFKLFSIISHEVSYAGMDQFRKDRNAHPGRSGFDEKTIPANGGP
jgi:hypothetical protein